jgi:15-cis-phytoene synthase
MITLSRVGEIVRRHDPDRFFTTLFAPAAKRETLWTLYAFNHELARANETVREPTMALIRLQWWREVVEGARRRHEVAEPLRDALEAGALREPDLLAAIEAREAEPPQTLNEWAAFIEGTAGAIAVAAAHALGARQVDGIRAAGAAYGAAGVLRNLALAGSRPIPGLADAGRAKLAEARRRHIPRPALAAALPAVFAARDLRRATPVRERGAGDKLAVLLAAARGRV